MEGSR
ncbi:lipocalin-like domain protein, partial [Vibrio cholerae HC-65A1]